ncbi:MAG: PEP-CTERM sorting domain-containing protein [Bythopirellula sp.]
MKKILSLAVICLMATPLSAQPVVDGTKAGDPYGPALSVQTIETGFGDNENEWNAAYGSVDAGTLYLMFTGNLQGNFNKLEVFIDTVAGGSNVLDTVGNDGAGAMNGMTLDTRFAPEYHLIFRRGNAGSDKFDVDLASLNSGAGGAGALIIDGGGVGPGSDIFGGSQSGSASGIAGTSLAVAYDGSNVAGIDGCDTPADSGCQAADQAAALAVDTGLELSIDLADLGSPAAPIKVMLLQNNDNHDFLSNQTLGGLPVGTGNLGSPASGVDFTAFAGNQYFAIPEPVTLALAGVGLLALGTSRLRRNRS